MFVNLTIVVHMDDDGSMWSEVVEKPGCFAAGFDWPELCAGIAEAVTLWDCSKKLPDPHSWNCTPDQTVDVCGTCGSIDRYSEIHL